MACFVLAHLVIFAVLFRTVYNTWSSGTGLFYEYAGRLLAGQVPYRDFPLEYPPLALVFFTLPRLAGASFADYYVGYQTEVVLCDIVVLFALRSIAKRAGTSEWLILGAYTTFVVAVGPIVLHQYDLFPAALTLLAILWFQRDRPTAGWVVLTLGVLTKLYPLLLFPVFALPLFVRRDWRGLTRAAIAAAVTMIVVLAPLMVLAPTAIGGMFAYHGRRGLQLESSYSSLLLLAEKLGMTHVGIAFSFGAWHLTGQDADTFAAASTGILALSMIGCVAVLYRFASRSDRHALTQTDARAAACVFLLCIAMATSKVLSPQYLVWLVPLLPLMPARRRWAAWSVFIVIGLMSYYIFPAHYNQLVYEDDGVVIAMLVTRNLLLLALAALAVASLRGSGEPARA